MGDELDGYESTLYGRRREDQMGVISDINRQDAATGRAIDDIRVERQRQIHEEGWTSAHDDEHDEGEMALAAAAYVVGSVGEGNAEPCEAIWPETWSSAWYKPGEPRRMLVKAGALIVAEIERLDRMEASRGA